jgi:short-subunit dehydrogenase
VGVGRTEPKAGDWLPSEAESSFVVGNVAESETSTAAFKRASELGRTTLLINSAGTGVFGPAGSYSSDDIALALEGNLIGTILFCEAAIRDFREAGGQIVNVISTAGSVARPNETVYCAAKWGARGYTESIRAELKGSGIDVVAVYPGGLHTSFWAHAVNPPTDGTGYMEPDEVARTLISALDTPTAFYVSDIYINRR